MNSVDSEEPSAGAPPPTSPERLLRNTFVWKNEGRQTLTAVANTDETASSSTLEATDPVVRQSPRAAVRSPLAASKAAGSPSPQQASPQRSVVDHQLSPRGRLHLSRLVDTQTGHRLGHHAEDSGLGRKGEHATRWGDDIRREWQQAIWKEERDDLERCEARRRQALQQAEAGLLVLASDGAAVVLDYYREVVQQIAFGPNPSRDDADGPWRSWAEEAWPEESRPTYGGGSRNDGGTESKEGCLSRGVCGDPTAVSLARSIVQDGWTKRSTVIGTGRAADVARHLSTVDSIASSIDLPRHLDGAILSPLRQLEAALGIGPVDLAVHGAFVGTALVAPAWVTLRDRFRGACDAVAKRDREQSWLLSSLTATREEERLATAKAIAELKSQIDAANAAHSMLTSRVSWLLSAQDEAGAQLAEAQTLLLQQREEAETLQLTLQETKARLRDADRHAEHWRRIAMSERSQLDAFRRSFFGDDNRPMRAHPVTTAPPLEDEWEAMKHVLIGGRPSDDTVVWRESATNSPQPLDLSADGCGSGPSSASLAPFPCLALHVMWANGRDAVVASEAEAFTNTILAARHACELARVQQDRASALAEVDELVAMLEDASTARAIADSECSSLQSRLLVMEDALQQLGRHAATGGGTRLVGESEFSGEDHPTVLRTKLRLAEERVQSLEDKIASDAALIGALRQDLHAATMRATRNRGDGTQHKATQYEGSTDDVQRQRKGPPWRVSITRVPNYPVLISAWEVKSRQTLRKEQHPFSAAADGSRNDATTADDLEPQPVANEASLTFDETSASMTFSPPGSPSRRRRTHTLLVVDVLRGVWCLFRVQVTGPSPQPFWGPSSQTAIAAVLDDSAPVGGAKSPPHFTVVSLKCVATLSAKDDVLVVERDQLDLPASLERTPTPSLTPFFGVHVTMKPLAAQTSGSAVAALKSTLSIEGSRRISEDSEFADTAQQRPHLRTSNRTSLSAFFHSQWDRDRCYELMVLSVGSCRPVYDKARKGQGSSTGAAEVAMADEDDDDGPPPVQVYCPGLAAPPHRAGGWHHTIVTPAEASAQPAMILPSGPLSNLLGPLASSLCVGALSRSWKLPGSDEKEADASVAIPSQCMVAASHCPFDLLPVQFIVASWRCELAEATLPQATDNQLPFIFGAPPWAADEDVRPPAPSSLASASGSEASTSSALNWTYPFLPALRAQHRTGRHHATAPANRQAAIRHLVTNQLRVGDAAAESPELFVISYERPIELRCHNDRSQRPLRSPDEDTNMVAADVVVAAAALAIPAHDDEDLFFAVRAAFASEKRKFLHAQRRVGVSMLLAASDLSLVGHSSVEWTERHSKVHLPSPWATQDGAGPNDWTVAVHYRATVALFAVSARMPLLRRVSAVHGVVGGRRHLASVAVTIGDSDVVIVTGSTENEDVRVAASTAAADASGELCRLMGERMPAADYVVLLQAPARGAESAQDQSTGGAVPLVVSLSRDGSRHQTWQSHAVVRGVHIRGRQPVSFVPPGSDTTANSASVSRYWTFDEFDDPTAAVETEAGSPALRSASRRYLAQRSHYSGSIVSTVVCRRVHVTSIDRPAINDGDVTSANQRLVSGSLCLLSSQATRPLDSAGSLRESRCVRIVFTEVTFRTLPKGFVPASVRITVTAPRGEFHVNPQSSLAALGTSATTVTPGQDVVSCCSMNAPIEVACDVLLPNWQETGERGLLLVSLDVVPQQQPLEDVGRLSTVAAEEDRRPPPNLLAVGTLEMARGGALAQVARYVNKTGRLLSGDSGNVRIQLPISDRVLGTHVGVLSAQLTVQELWASRSLQCAPSDGSTLSGTAVM